MIEVENLQKRFWIRQHHHRLAGTLRNLVTRRGREVRAVDGISFRVAAGEMVGYIGPNGAGKSTTVKMLTGILVPSGGRVTVAGLVPWRQRRSLARRIGVVFGQRTQLWWDLPLIESLYQLRHIYHVPAERFAANLKVLRDLLDLDGFLDTPVRQLSLGQRMRGDGHGRLLYDGAVAAIHDRFGLERTLVVDLAEDETLDGPLNVGPATQVRADCPRRWLRFRREEITAAALIAAVSTRYRIRDLTIEEPEIEGIVRRIYEEGL
jgi:ABC-2 type transport system ATP-binding protein